MKRSWFIVAGLVLACAGAAGLLVGSVPYEDEEVLLDAGSLEASASVEKEWSVPPMLAGTTLAVGGILLTAGAVRSE